MSTEYYPDSDVYINHLTEGKWTLTVSHIELGSTYVIYKNFSLQLRTLAYHSQGRFRKANVTPKAKQQI